MPRRRCAWRSDNWTVQREPADLRILAEAAHATGDAAALQTVRDWLAATGLEYPAVAKLVEGRGGRQMSTARMLALLAALLFALLHGVALAHKPSDSYLTLDVEGETINGQWDIALRDLDFAIGLDSNQDGAITWGEVKAKHREIAAYALSRLTLGSAEARVPDGDARAAHRQPQRRRLRGAALHRGLPVGAQPFSRSATASSSTSIRSIAGC